MYQAGGGAASGQELRWHDHIEAIAWPQQVALLLQSFGGVQESAGAQVRVRATAWSRVKVRLSPRQLILGVGRKGGRAFKGHMRASAKSADIFVQ